MKFKLLALTLFIAIEVLSQGIVGSGNVSDNGVEILMQDGFSSASLDLAGSPRDLTKWTKSTESGTPGALSIITSASTWGQEYGYETGSASYLKYVFGSAGSTNGVYLWSPSIALPNRTDLFARVSIRSNGSWTGGGTLTLGMAFDGNNDQAADASPSLISTVFTGAGPYNNDYSTFFSSGSNYIRTVYFDLTSFANQTGRLGILLKGASMFSSEAFQLDWFVVGTRPTNDLCSGAIALGDQSIGVNGGANGYYNSTASGLTPSNSQSGVYEGGPIIYVGSGTNGIGSIPNSSTVKDGYEPSSNGSFGTSSITNENSTWYKFTTPDVACNTGNLTIQLTLQNLSCATSITKIPNQLQAEIFPSSVCGSTSAVTPTGFTSSATAHAWNNNTTITSNNLAYNATYYILIDAVNGNDCRYNLQLTTLINGLAVSAGCIVLPIELVAFEAIPLANKVLVHWETASETNNKLFTVERSSDAINFETVAFKDGKSNSTQLTKYDVYDENPAEGQNYYRLKQTDLNGNFTYSKIITLNPKASNNSKLIRITNIFGDEVSENYTGVKILFYSDGSIAKQLSAYANK